MEDVLDSTTSIHCPRLEMASRSKLSCVCWNSYIKHLLLAADYDGCLSLWDAQSNVCTGNFDDHGKRVWSADFSTVRLLLFHYNLQTPYKVLGSSLKVFIGCAPFQQFAAAYRAVDSEDWGSLMLSCCPAVRGIGIIMGVRAKVAECQICCFADGSHALCVRR